MSNHGTKTALIAAIDTMRNTRPLVQCLTNALPIRQELYNAPFASL